tara:strand:+ start:299 stop:1102 length:804 start_codon:yes stop_codon:yes gene_type:complete
MSCLSKSDLKTKPKGMSIEQYRITIDWIETQDTKIWKTSKCPFDGCDFTQPKPNSSNLKKHCKRCNFSPGYKIFETSVDALIKKDSSLKPYEIQDNLYINRGDWGYKDSCKSDPENISGLFTFIRKEWTDWKAEKRTGNFAIRCLKKICCNFTDRTSISQSVKVNPHGYLEIYYNGAWINKETDFDNWNNQWLFLKSLWFEKIDQICNSRYMLFTDYTDLNLKLLEDIGKPETKANIEHKMDIFLEETYPITKKTLYDGPQMVEEKS